MYNVVTGYTIIIHSEGVSDRTFSVAGKDSNNHSISNGIDHNTKYSISLIATIDSLPLSSAGPVIAARGNTIITSISVLGISILHPNTGPGLVMKGVVFPNHGVLSRNPSVIGEDVNALYCVTDDVTCCGTSPSPNCCGTHDIHAGHGGSGNGGGNWYFPENGRMSSGTANQNLWYASWLNGAVLMNFRGTSTSGTSGLYRCDIRDSMGTRHQFYICLYDNAIASQCKLQSSVCLTVLSLSLSPVSMVQIFTVVLD